ncbi:MAG: hypothetical protein DME19_15305 [Verrucomicrobia bacterium]|nr:MAG: hypothetical protein DME19_15305 [Verrucomicrobiota bacterium]
MIRPCSTSTRREVWRSIAIPSDLIDYGIYAVTNSRSLPTLLVARSASTLAGVFSTPPFGAAGSPANNADASGPRIWVEVELRQVGDTVTLTINNTQILQVTNPTSFTNGVIMLGMNDQFNSIGSDKNYVIFDNVRVIGLGPAGPAPPNITGAQLAGGNVQIDFAGAGNDAASAFAVESSPEVATGYATETGATVFRFPLKGGGLPCAPATRGALREPSVCAESWTDSSREGCPFWDCRAE